MKLGDNDGNDDIGKMRWEIVVDGSWLLLLLLMLLLLLLKVASQRRCVHRRNQILLSKCQLSAWKILGLQKTVGSALLSGIPKSKMSRGRCLRVLRTLYRVFSGVFKIFNFFSHCFIGAWTHHTLQGGLLWLERVINKYQKVEGFCW